MNALQQYGKLTGEGWIPGENLTPKALLECLREVVEEGSQHQWIVADILNAAGKFEGVVAFDWESGEPLAELPADNIPWLELKTVGEPDELMELPTDIPEGTKLIVPFDVFQAATLSDHNESSVSVWRGVGRRFPHGRRSTYYVDAGPWPVRFSHFQEVYAAHLDDEFVDSLLRRRAAEGLSTHQMREIVQAERQRHIGDAGQKQPSTTLWTLDDVLAMSKTDLAAHYREAGISLSLAKANEASEAALKWLWMDCPDAVLRAILKARRGIR